MWVKQSLQFLRKTVAATAGCNNTGICDGSFSIVGRFVTFWWPILNLLFTVIPDYLHSWSTTKSSGTFMTGKTAHTNPCTHMRISQCPHAPSAKFKPDGIDSDPTNF